MKANSFMIGYRKVKVWVVEVDDQSSGEQVIFVDNKDSYDDQAEDSLRDEREAEQQRILERF